MSIITLEMIKDMKESFENSRAIFNETKLPVPWRLKGKITQEEYNKKAEEEVSEIKKRLGLL